MSACSCKMKLRSTNLSGNWFEIEPSSFMQNCCGPWKECYTRLLLPATEAAILRQPKEAADEKAVAVFARNLRELLLARRLPKVTIGIDPGFRTGCKVAVVDGTGKFVASATIYPTAPRNESKGPVTR